MRALLEVERINSYYGDSHILFDVSLQVARNEVVALLGRNGAGKSTTLKSLIGTVRPRSGRIVLDGTPTHALPPHAIAALGLGRAHAEIALAAGAGVVDLPAAARAPAQPRHRLVGR